MKLCDFTLPEVKHFLAECNFTEDERIVFTELSHGNTLENTAEVCNMSISTVKRIKARIWAKIERLMAL